VYEFRLADVGEGIHEVQLLEWHVRPGDEVSEYQPLCQVESAKATVELTSPVAGRVHETRVPQGGTAQVGDVLVVLDTALGIVGSAPSRRVRAAPLVRKLARDQGIPLDDVAGSGPQGRIRLADLEQHVQHRQAAEPAGERLELRGVRRRMAEHMAEATRIPAVTAIDTFDVTDLVWTRDELLGHAEAEGVHLTYLPFVVKAAVEALRAVPEANSVFDEHGPAILYKREYHIGIAVAAPAGLLVPVVRNADRLSLMELAVELARLAEAARQEKLSPADLSGSTFTITSFGGLSGGVQFATPIVNSPEVAILGVGRIEQQPRVIDGQVVPRHCVGVSFTFDHRVLDGEGAGRFLATLRRYLERPSELLLRLR
jgi:pyruvate dehydrogenase E2 component (dihydrolipoamide acetyltransferase)